MVELSEAIYADFVIVDVEEVRIVQLDDVGSVVDITLTMPVTATPTPTPT